MDKKYLYAQLNEQNIVIGIAALTEEDTRPNMVEIQEFDYDLYNRKYENGAFSEEKYLPDASAIQLSEFQQIQQDMGNMLLESAVDKLRISELETTQGDLLMEIALLKMGGIA